MCIYIYIYIYIICRASTQDEGGPSKGGFHNNR